MQDQLADIVQFSNFGADGPVPVGSRPASRSICTPSSRAPFEQPVVGTPQLSVDGGVVATSFTGEGSALTNLTPANLSTAGCSEDDVLTLVGGQWVCAPGLTLAFAEFVGSVAQGSCPAGTRPRAVSIAGTSSNLGECIFQTSPTFPYIAVLTFRYSSSPIFHCSSSVTSPLANTCRCMAICR